GGTFTTIGGQARSNIAALDATTGVATSWRPKVNAAVVTIAPHPSGGTLYVGGSFTTASQSARGFAAIDASSGADDTAWPETNGTVSVVTPDGTGGWYIGGSFTQVGGLNRTNLAHILADKSVSAWAPNPNGVIQALAVNGS